MTKTDFDELWLWAEDELELLWEQEKAISSSPPEKNRSLLFSRLAVIYLRYIVVARKLDLCYRSLLHVQKRKDISLLIRAILGRIVELKNELTVLDFNETPFLGSQLKMLKLPPDQVDPPVTLFSSDSLETHNKKLVKRVLVRLERHFRLSSDATVMSWDEAVSFIQIHERARQGRLRFQLMKQIRQQKIQAGRGLHKLRPAMNSNTAALKIQSAWRSYLALKRVRQLRHKEMVFLGMVPLSYEASTEVIRAKDLEIARTLKQSELETKFNLELEILRERLRIREGPIMKERFLNTIRRWYIDYHDLNGKFPEIPLEEEGGSKTILKLETTSAPPIHIEIPNPQTKKENPPPVTSKAAGVVPRKRAEEDKPKGVEMSPSLWLENIVQENQKYYDVWRHRSEVGSVGWDAGLLKEQVNKELEEEMRLEADQQARNELERLRSAHDRDRGRKSKKGRKSARKAAKKSKRGRKEKDLTPDRSLESLIEELVQSGIIRSYPKANIEDFFGLLSVVDPLSRKWKRDSFPSLGDIRCSVIENCILTLGSEEIRMRTPLTRSVLLAGPHGSGKTFLIHAICSHVGATLFDLSNSNIMGRYPGKAGMTMLLHLITKVSRLLQPAVIVVEDVDRLFMKKSGRSERWDMRRLRKELPKILRAIEPEFRVLLIGTTCNAWDCDQRSLSTCFQRMIGIPPPDYGTRLTMWSRFILKSTGSFLPSPADLTNLARISDSYTPGSIKNCILSILSERRKQLLPRQSLRAEEFVPALARFEPVYKEDEENLRLWYGKTPLRRKRHRNADADEEENVDSEKTKSSKRKKKKKKGVTSKKIKKKR